LSNSNQISTPPILNFMEICPAVSVLIHAGGQTDERTDLTKLIVAFRNYVNAPKNTRYTTVTFKMFIRVPTKTNKNQQQIIGVMKSAFLVLFRSLPKRVLMYTTEHKYAGKLNYIN